MVRTLRETLARRKRRRIERPQRAAVLVPIIDDGGPLRLLLTRRTEELPTHQGQVAFPGGFMDHGETDPVSTALRESKEEVGLPPDRVEILGALDDFVDRTDTVAVTPVVGRIVDLPPLIPCALEVARIFYIPVDDLARPGRWSSRTERAVGVEYRLYFFEHDRETLWGLSAKVTLQLLEVLGLGSPAGPLDPD